MSYVIYNMSYLFDIIIISCSILFVNYILHKIYNIFLFVNFR